MLDDIIRETWFYQDIYQEGKEEGIQALRLAVLDVIQERFPEIVEFATKHIVPIKDSMVLRRLIVLPLILLVTCAPLPQPKRRFLIQRMPRLC